MKNKSGSSLPIFIILFMGGFSGLVYEVVWQRTLILTFGGTVFSTSAILCAILGGLSLGSWLSGKLSVKYPPMLLIALSQAILAMMALLLIPLFSWMTSLYVFIHHLIDPGFATLTAIRFVLSVMVLIIPSSLIAAVFPLASQAVINHKWGIGRGVAAVYSVDTLGAVAGTTVCGFFLLGSFGINGTVLTAAVINITAAAAAFFIYKSEKVIPEVLLQEEKKHSPHSPQLSPRAVSALVVCFALSGAAALSYEVLVTKVLVHHLQMHIYSFTIMLACFLFGMGAGSLVCVFLLKKPRKLLLLFGIAEAGIAVLGFSMPMQFLWTPAIKSFLENSLSGLRSAGMEWAINSGETLVVLLPITMLMGATLPLLTAALTPAFDKLGKRVGSLYAVNTLGSVAGIVITTFIILPAAGFKTGFFIAAFVNLTVAAVALYYSGSGKRTKWVIAGASLVLSAASIYFSSTASLKPVLLSRSGVVFRDNAKADVVFFREGANGSVAVVEKKGSRKACTRHMVMNGHFEGGSDISSLRAFQLLGNLPFIMHSDHQNGKNVLVLAFGMGITLGTVADNNSDSIFCVEMVPEVLDAADYFSEYNNDVLDNPKAEVFIEDARNFLLTTGRKYDIVILDATHPAMGDSWLLYTSECYESVKTVLAEGGVAAQWIPFHGLSQKSYLSIIRTFQSVFEHTTLWTPPDASHTVIAGTSSKPAVDFHYVNRLFSERKTERNMQKAAITDPIQFLSYFTADSKTLGKYSSDAKLNTDNLPVVQFNPQYVSFSEEFMIYDMLTTMKKQSNIILYNSGPYHEQDTSKTLYNDFTKSYLSDIFTRKGFLFYNMYNLSKGPVSRGSKRRLFINKSISAFREALNTDPENLDAGYMLDQNN